MWSMFLAPIAPMVGNAFICLDVQSAYLGHMPYYV